MTSIMISIDVLPHTNMCNLSDVSDDYRIQIVSYLLILNVFISVYKEFKCFFAKQFFSYEIPLE